MPIERFSRRASRPSDVVDGGAFEISALRCSRSDAGQHRQPSNQFSTRESASLEAAN
jgi:hypothetical protein